EPSVARDRSIRVTAVPKVRLRHTSLPERGGCSPSRTRWLGSGSRNSRSSVLPKLPVPHQNNIDPVTVSDVDLLSSVTERFDHDGIARLDLDAEGPFRIRGRTNSRITLGEDDRVA